MFTDPPVLRVTYLAGTFTTLVLRLPVVVSRFVEGVTLEQAPFFERWKIIGGELASLRSGLCQEMLISIRCTKGSSIGFPYKIDFYW